MKLPRPCLLQALLLVFVFSPIVLLPSAVHAQDVQCPNPNTGRGGTPAERAVRFQAAAEAAASSTPPDPCLEMYLERSFTPGQDIAAGNQHAIELSRIGLAHAEIAWGAESIDLVPFLTGLAERLDRFRVSQGASHDPAELQEAESLIQRAIAVTEKAYGPDDIHEAPLLSQLAAVAFNEEELPTDYPARTAKIEGIYQHELAVEEKAYGSASPRLTGTLQRLAGEYSNERIACSMPYSGHPLAPQEYANCITKGFEQSDGTLLREIQIIKASPNPNGPESAALDSPLQLLAQNLLIEGKYPEAEDAYRQMAEIDAKAFGPASLVTDYQGLAGAYRADHNYASAQEFLIKALEIAKQLPPLKTTDPNLSLFVHVLFALGNLSLQQSDVVGARNYFQQELDEAAKERPDSDPVMIQTLYSIASSYLRSNQIDDAQPPYLRLISTAEKNPPAATDTMGRIAQNDYIMGLRDYANLLQRTHHDSDAEGVYLKMISFTGSDPSLKSEYAFALEYYSGLLRGMGRTDEAQTMLLRLISIGQSDPGLASQYTWALQNYADLLRKMNKPDDAAKVDAQLKAFNDKPASLPMPAAAAQ